MRKENTAIGIWLKYNRKWKQVTERLRRTFKYRFQVSLPVPNNVMKSGNSRILLWWFQCIYTVHTPKCTIDLLDAWLVFCEFTDKWDTYMSHAAFSINIAIFTVNTETVSAKCGLDLYQSITFEDQIFWKRVGIHLLLTLSRIYYHKIQTTVKSYTYIPYSTFIFWYTRPPQSYSKTEKKVLKVVAHDAPKPPEPNTTKICDHPARTCHAHQLSDSRVLSHQWLI